MNPSVASLICACGIAGLLYLDREKTVRTSRALWLPGIWLGIIGSRPLSEWLGVSEPGSSAKAARIEGSPLDAAVFGLLVAIAIAVLIYRKRRTQTLLLANWPILVYFLYCLVSVSWAYHSDIAFKHWVKAIGDLAMALIVATDGQPVAAIRRLVSRIGIVLFPTSVLLIKYFGDLGRSYTSDGLPMVTGVTDNKNSLGLIVLVVSLVVLWNVRSLLIHKDEPNRGRRLVAQSALLAFGMSLFWMAQCSTGKACFLLGSLLIITLNFRVIKGRPARVHALCFAMLAGGLVMFLVGQADVASALGRDSSFSGRTEIWEAVLPSVPHSMTGAGFESYWISPNVRIFQRTLLDSGWYPPLVENLNESHNGYIEIYMNLGWIGVCLLAFVLIAGYKRACDAFHLDPELGSLFLAYVAVAVVYSLTEAGFRTMMPSWIFLLLAVVSASGVTTGLFGREKPNVPDSRSGTVSTTEGFNPLVPKTETVDRRLARVEFNSTSTTQTIWEMR